MSDDFRRRRRLSNTGTPRRSSGGGGMNPWFITVLAAIAVIAGGWFLGQALARVFNGAPRTQVAQAPTSQPAVTPVPSPSPQATAAPSVEPTRTPKPKPSPTAKPTPAPTPSAAATAQPSPVSSARIIEGPSATPVPTVQATTAATPAGTRHTQPIGRRLPPTPAAAPSAEGGAARVVRAYIEALRQGDPATASTYLGNGSPDESFINSSTRITSISQTPNGDGSYKVAVDMQTTAGEYYETFTVASDKILEKTAIKP